MIDVNKLSIQAWIKNVDVAEYHNILTSISNITEKDETVYINQSNP